MLSITEKEVFEWILHNTEGNTFESNYTVWSIMAKDLDLEIISIQKSISSLNLKDVISKVKRGQYYLYI